MNAYKNLAGNKGVTAYKCGDDSIRVRFDTTKVYIYDHKYTGKQHVETMKALAMKGLGLNKYIDDQEVKDKYSVYIDQPQILVRL